MSASALTFLAASPASASATYIDTSGANATYNVMVGLFGGTQSDGTVIAPSGQNPQVNNIAAGQTTGTIPSGTDCNGVTFGNGPDTWSTTNFPSSTAGNPAPNGSTEGKDALYNEETNSSIQGTYNGCYDIARSSSAPSVTSPPTAPDTTNFQYYAYALDAVTFIVGSDATAGAGLAPGAPAQLSLQEVYNIYDCTYNNWDQVTVGYTPSGLPIHGANAPIYRYWPNKGSGTLSMAQNMLSSVAINKDNPNGKGFDPTTAAYNPPGSGAGDGGTNSNCANGILNYNGPFISEESNETVIANSTPAQDAGAIFPYSVGEFVSQWNNSADYNSYSGPGGSANFDPSLLLASLADLGSLTNDALPYQYGDTTVSPAGNPNYPYPPYTKYTFTTGSEGNSFVTDQADAVLQINETVVTEGNEWYEEYGTTQDLTPGIRYMYNVIDTVLPTYATVLQLIGFNNTGSSITADGVTIPAGFKSPLCADTDIGPDSTGTPASIITAAGFVPLGTQGGPTGSDATGSHCRLLVAG